MWRDYGTVVVKPSYGYAGQDVERITARFDQQETLVERLLQEYGSVLVQQFIPHPDGDIRTTLIGNEIAFGIRRIPNENTWKANVAQGAHWTFYEPTEAVRDLTFQAARVMGISIAGLDILQHQGNLSMAKRTKVCDIQSFKKKAVEMRMSGMTYQQIAEELGIQDTDRVKVWMCKYKRSINVEKAIIFSI